MSYATSQRKRSHDEREACLLKFFVCGGCDLRSGQEYFGMGWWTCAKDCGPEKFSVFFAADFDFLPFSSQLNNPEVLWWICKVIVTRELSLPS
jgi:hypothetical protein